MTAHHEWPERAIRIAEELEHRVMTERDGSLWCSLCNTDCGADGRGHALTCVLLNDADAEGLTSGEGWIVGNADGTQWRSWQNGAPEWVDRRGDATRYARRCDAEAVHGEDEGAWRVEPVCSQADEIATIEEWEHDDQRELSRLYNHRPDESPQFNRAQMRAAIRHGKRLAATPSNHAGSVGEADHG